MRGSFSFEMRERGRDEESSLHEIWSPISLLQLGCQDLWPHHLPWTTTKNNRKLRQKYSRELFSARSGDFLFPLIGKSLYAVSIQTQLLPQLETIFKCVQHHPLATH